MFIEVCDNCQTQWNLVDICDEDKVLCHRCLRDLYPLLDCEITFSGDLHSFNAFVGTLKVMNELL